MSIIFHDKSSFNDYTIEDAQIYTMPPGYFSTTDAFLYTQGLWTLLHRIQRDEPIYQRDVCEKPSNDALPSQISYYKFIRPLRHVLAENDIAAAMTMKKWDRFPGQQDWQSPWGIIFEIVILKYGIYVVYTQKDRGLLIHKDLLTLFPDSLPRYKFSRQMFNIWQGIYYAIQDEELLRQIDMKHPEWQIARLFSSSFASGLIGTLKSNQQCLL